MKKIIILLVALLTCLTAVFAGCGDSTGYDNKLTGFEGEVSSNGGFAVQKGEYIYFINGVETHTTDNTYGKVEMGALARIKKSDLSSTEKKPEIVIPSLFVAGDKTSGFYIFDNDVYYATPSTAKNKAGEIENSKLCFTKTSLDGKTSVIFETVANNATQYRFVKSNGVVYLVLNTVKTVQDEHGHDEEIKIVKVINTVTKEAKDSDKMESVIFVEGTDVSFDSVYFTVTAHDEALDKDEAFNELWKMNLDGTKNLLLNGKDFGVSGAKITLIKETETHLYFSAAYVDTSVTSVTEYYALVKSSNEKILLNNGSKSAATIFGANSWYNSVDSIVYLDATYGLIEYNYTNPENLPEGRRLIGYGKDLIGYTVKFWQDGFLYLTDSSSNYYRVDVEALIDNPSNDVVAERITIFADSAWYTPEVIGDHFFSITSEEPYTALVFATKLGEFHATEEEAKEALEKTISKIKESNKAQIKENLDKFSISFRSTAAQEAIDKYLEDNVTEEDHSGHNH